MMDDQSDLGAPRTYRAYQLVEELLLPECQVERNCRWEPLDGTANHGTCFLCHRDRIHTTAVIRPPWQVAPQVALRKSEMGLVRDICRPIQDLHHDPSNHHFGDH